MFLGQGERKWLWREELGFGLAMADNEDNASSVLDADSFIETESPEVIIARIEDKLRQVERLLRIPHYTEALETAALMDAPTQTRDERCKSANWLLVHCVLMAIKDVDGLLLGSNPELHVLHHGVRIVEGFLSRRRQAYGSLEDAMPCAGIGDQCLFHSAIKALVLIPGISLFRAHYRHVVRIVMMVPGDMLMSMTNKEGRGLRSWPMSHCNPHLVSELQIFGQASS